MSRRLLSNTQRCRWPRFRQPTYGHLQTQKLVLAPTFITFQPTRRNYSNAIKPHEKIEPDYYKILGIARDATQAEIKTAYLKLAKKLHPDTNDDPDAKTQFNVVRDAYDFLQDIRQRRDYDERWKRQNPVVKIVFPATPKAQATKVKTEPAKSQQTEPDNVFFSNKEEVHRARVAAMEKEEKERKIREARGKNGAFPKAEAPQNNDERKIGRQKRRQENKRRIVDGSKKYSWSQRVEPGSPRAKLSKEENDRIQNKRYERQMADIKNGGKAEQQEPKKEEEKKEEKKKEKWTLTFNHNVAILLVVGVVIAFRLYQERNRAHFSRILKSDLEEHVLILNNIKKLREMDEKARLTGDMTERDKEDRNASFGVLGEALYEIEKAAREHGSQLERFQEGGYTDVIRTLKANKDLVGVRLEKQEGGMVMLSLTLSESLRTHLAEHVSILNNLKKAGDMAVKERRPTDASFDALVRELCSIEDTIKEQARENGTYNSVTQILKGNRDSVGVVLEERRVGMRTERTVKYTPTTTQKHTENLGLKLQSPNSQNRPPGVKFQPIREDNIGKK